MGKQLTTEDYKKRLASVRTDYILIDEYINMSTKIKHLCLKHNVDFPQSPQHVLEGKCGCPSCQKENALIKGKERRMTNEEFLAKLKELYGDEYIPLEEYIKSDVKIKFLHNIKNGISHTFYSTPNSLLRGQGCGVCKGLQVCVGYNDFNTVFPELAKNLVDYDFGYTVTAFSGKRTKIKCPNCGHIKNLEIRDYAIRGLSCPKCSDGISYPNKFMYNLLHQVKEKLDFLDREFTPEWGIFEFNNERRTCRYDIYFGYKNHEYIIEMDGGINHNGERFIASTKEESQYIDSQKDNLAKAHNITMIRVDCDYGREDRYTYIKNNIYTSLLSTLFDMDIFDFDSANIISQNSLLVESCKLWDEKYTIADIAKIIGLHPTTISRYIRSGYKMGLCTNYSIKEGRMRSLANPVICLNYKKIFPSIIEGANYYGLEAGQISKCCRKAATFGGYYNGEKLIWMYLDEYEKLSSEEIDAYVPKTNDWFISVVCLETGEEFENAISGARYGGVEKGTGVLNCCRGKAKYCGAHPETKKKLHWMFKYDYENASKEDIAKIINEPIYKIGKKKVICTDTLELFDNATVASEWCGLNNKLPIQRVCRGETVTAGVHPIDNYDLHWMYYKEYVKKFGEVVKIA